jgi:hypothetical protein
LARTSLITAIQAMYNENPDAQAMDMADGGSPRWQVFPFASICVSGAAMWRAAGMVRCLPG